MQYNFVDVGGCTVKDCKTVKGPSIVISGTQKMLIWKIMILVTFRRTGGVSSSEIEIGPV